ncbi:TerD family protein [Streptomyces sp. NPDC056728]
MTTTSLLKGQNASLSAGPVTFTVAAQGLAADVSALLLGPEGKVRSDADLVFYNHPVHDGVSLAGHTITADLDRLPGGVATVVVVASADRLIAVARMGDDGTPAAAMAVAGLGGLEWA